MDQLYPLLDVLEEIHLDSLVLLWLAVHVYILYIVSGENSDFNAEYMHIRMFIPEFTCVNASLKCLENLYGHTQN